MSSRLASQERSTIRDMVEAEEYKHLSLRSLALLGKRLGKVFASYGTWCRLVREHGWRRPRRRLYPHKPKVGLRASTPNEWWHVDVTIIRLLVAQVDIVQSNSMVEAVWSQLRHRWLYLHTLDSFAGLDRLVDSYFADHNSLIPRVELGGRTPDEAYYGRELDLAERHRAQHAEARARRVTTNRSVSCHLCGVEGQHVAPSPAASNVP